MLLRSCLFCLVVFFFFNDTATTEIYTLSLHDALPIWSEHSVSEASGPHREPRPAQVADRKSTRLNSSHGYISYAVFCLKKKKTKPTPPRDARFQYFWKSRTHPPGA